MSFLTAEQISSLALPLLRRSLVLPATVTRSAGAEYAGPSGGTVYVRVRVPRTARVQATPGTQINFDAHEELQVGVRLTHLYNAAHVTDEDLTLNLEDFGRQVLEPMVAAVAEGAENQVAAVINNLPAEDTADADDIDAAMLRVREALTKRGNPAGSRFLVASPDVMTAILATDKHSQANTTGGTTALEQASIGRRYGMTVVESAALDPGTLVGYHSSAIVWANRVPAEASGADSSTASDSGIGLRVVRSFDISHLQEAVAVSSFSGASLVEDSAESAADPEQVTPRIIKLTVNAES